MPQYAHTGWQVTSIDPNAYVTAASGDAVYGARVGFRTNAGNAGSVFVRDEDLTTENVTAAVDQRAAIMDTVASLQQPPGTAEV